MRSPAPPPSNRKRLLLHFLCSSQPSSSEPAPQQPLVRFAAPGASPASTTLPLPTARTPCGVPSQVYEPGELALLASAENATSGSLLRTSYLRTPLLGLRPTGGRPSSALLQSPTQRGTLHSVTADKRLNHLPCRRRHPAMWSTVSEQRQPSTGGRHLHPSLTVLRPYSWLSGPTRSGAGTSPSCSGRKKWRWATQGSHRAVDVSRTTVYKRPTSCALPPRTNTCSWVRQQTSGCTPAVEAGIYHPH
jgi:hypothetical protein